MAVILSREPELNAKGVFFCKNINVSSAILSIPQFLHASLQANSSTLCTVDRRSGLYRPHFHVSARCHKVS